jgi:hypothetical protein
MTSSGLTYRYRRACTADAGKAGIGGRHNALVTDAYELIRAATLARRQVLATYKGYRRELCPHVLGTKEGRRQALFFQFGGGSSSALPPGGEWRCIPVDGLEEVVGREGPWHTGVRHQHLETCVDTIDVEASCQ